MRASSSFSWRPGGRRRRWPGASEPVEVLLRRPPVHPERLSQVDRGASVRLLAGAALEDLWDRGDERGEVEPSVIERGPGQRQPAGDGGRARRGCPASACGREDRLLRSGHRRTTRRRCPSRRTRCGLRHGDRLGELVAGNGDDLSVAEYRVSRAGWARESARRWGCRSAAPCGERDALSRVEAVRREIRLRAGSCCSLLLRHP